MSKTTIENYKNIKRAATITAATAAAVTTGAMSANVHADTVNNNQPQSAQQTNDQAQKQAAVKNAQEAVNQDTQTQAQAQTNVNNAQSKADQANQAQTDAQQKADQAQANVNNDQKAVDDANATLKNAGQAPSQAEIDQAQTDANNTSAKTGQAQDAVNQAQAKVSDTQKNVDQANQTVKDDQSAIADLNTPVDPDAVPNAQAKVDADNTAVNNQNTAITHAQTDVNNAQTKAKQAKSSHDQAVADQANKQAAAKSAQDQANTAAKNLKDAQDELNALNQQDPVVENHLIVSDEYVNAFKAWEDAVKSGKQADIDKADKALALAGVHNNKLNHFQHSASDAAISVDWQNLTEEQRQELSIFAANLINDVRAAFNMPKTAVSPASVKMAQNIVNEYNTKNWDIFGEHMTDGQDHDTNDINAYADAHHWMISENAYGGLESWVIDNGFHKNPIQTQTMDSLKENIYEGMKGFMFGDEGSAFGHAQNAIGTWNPNDHTKFTGVAYDKYGYLHVNEAIVSDPQHAFWDPSKILDDPTADAARAALKKDAYDLQPSEDKLAAQKKAAQDRVNSASTANDQAQKALTDANNALKSANDQVTKTASDQAKANDALTAAQKSLSDAQAKLTDLQAQLANDEQVLATAKAKAEDAAHKAAKKSELQDKLTQDQKAAQDAQDALTNAQKAVKNTQDQLASAKDAQTKAANKLAQLKQTASDVKNAQKALNDAQAKLSADQADLTKAQTALKKAKDDAKSANDALTAAKNALTQINSKLAHDQKVLADAQEAAKTDAQRYADDIQIGDISIKPGDHHDLKPSISNPQASADGSITLPGQAGLKTLPFGTTAKWHDADKVAADAAHDGDYQEDVNITFPDGSTMTAKAHLLVVTPSAPVHSHGNSDKPVTPNAPVHDHNNSDKSVTPGEKHNGATSTSNVKIGKNSQLVVINNDATNTASAMPTREAYRAAQANKNNSNSKTAGLPQTGDSHEAGILAALGMVTGLAGLFGLRKKQD